MKKTIIIGGGITGLFSAYYLLQEGHSITLIDRGDLSDNCSTGNAGMIVPSHIIPLASPGMVAKGIRWMFSRKSPFYIHPRLDKKLLEWCLLFYRKANKSHVEKSIPFLKNLSLLSKALYLDFDEAHPRSNIFLQQKGLLMLYQSKDTQIEEIEAAHVAAKHGLKTEIFSAEELKAFEPNQIVNAIGGVYYPDDAHLSPQNLHTYLLEHLRNNGVDFQTNTEVKDFKISNNSITSVITDKAEYQADHILICGGSWSGLLAQKLGIKLPMMGGKGYTFIQNNKPEIKQAAILVEARVSVSPYTNTVRFGGTMEISGTNTEIDKQRVRGIFEAIQRYYPQFEAEFPEHNQIWKGLRPCSPDGLPYIGKSKGFSNLFFASGHSMMGLSLAPATGKIIAQVITNTKTDVAIDAFDPDRYR
jgi:D-amino-acid dehydrogenase